MGNKKTESSAKYVSTMMRDALVQNLVIAGTKEEKWKELINSNHNQSFLHNGTQYKDTKVATNVFQGYLCSSISTSGFT